MTVRSLPLPHTPDTLTGRPPQGKDEYWQAFVGPDEIALVLMKIPKDTGGKPQVVASMVEKVEERMTTVKYIDRLRCMREEIERWVQLGTEVHTALGIEVRLNPIGKES